MSSTIPITVEFTYVPFAPHFNILCQSLSNQSLSNYLRKSGGLENLFSNEKKQQLFLPLMREDGNAADIGFLVRYLYNNKMTDKRKEMFVLDNSVYVR